MKGPGANSCLWGRERFSDSRQSGCGKKEISSRVSPSLYKVPIFWSIFLPTNNVKQEHLYQHQQTGSYKSRVKFLDLSICSVNI